MAVMASPYPAHHSLCPLGSLSIPEPQLLGILEGDATVTLRRTSSGFRPSIRIAARDDDVTPFALWATVARARGSALGRLRRRADYRRNEWLVDDPADVIELAEWLGGTVPHPPRLGSLLGLARQGALELLTVSAASGPTRPDLNGLARQVRATNRGLVTLAPSDDLRRAADEHIAWLFSGLFGADGHLALRNRQARFAPVAVVSQRDDNAALLDLLAKRIALGEIHRQGRQLYWRVSRLEDCRELLGLLREYPLPLSSPRRRQLDVWGRALSLRDRRPSRSVALATLYDALREAKRYSGPRLLCSCPMPAQATETQGI